MSTPLLYHGFNVRGYELDEIRYEDGTMLFVVRQKDEDWIILLAKRSVC